MEPPSYDANGDGSGGDNLHSIINTAFHSQCCPSSSAVCFHAGNLGIGPQPHLKCHCIDPEAQFDGIFHTHKLDMIIYWNPSRSGGEYDCDSLASGSQTAN